LRNDESTTSKSDPADTQMASRMGGVFGKWSEAVGEAVAAHVKPVKLDGTKLIVEVDDPAWATQLRFLEGPLKLRLLEVAGATIDTIEARVRRY
jgi:predicted nucleic acid-binding Zn ribbon protein